MTERLRGLVSEKLTLVGVQLQDLWQETWTLGHFFKRAPSPLPSHHASNFPTTRANNDPPQETNLLFYDARDLNRSGPVQENPDRTDMENEQSQADSSNLSLPSNHDTDSDTSVYVNAVTQTELLSTESTPPTDYEDFRTDDEPGVALLNGGKEPRIDHDLGVKFPNMPSDQSSGTSCDDDAAPEVF
ncbi:MAG: hypothetical protein Q9221_006974 [Calogaya cf. arnoldii]